MQATRPVALSPRAARRAESGRRSRRLALRIGGAAGLLALLGALFVLVADAAGTPSQYVPAHKGGWPGWLAGPLQGIGAHLGSGEFQALTLIVCGGYLLALAAARELPRLALAGAIVLAHVILLLGPPLISQDVFGYLSFARLGALHGLDPYSHVAAEASGDPIFGFIGWPWEHSPYGPLFTLASYLLVPLGVAGGIWAMKVLAVLCSLGAVWLTARAAARMGRSPAFAAAFLGLNPVLLILAVGGAHNDTLALLLLAGAIALSTAPRPGPVTSRDRAAAALLAAGVGIKLTAGLAAPFLVLAPARMRERLDLARAALLTVLAVGVVAVIGFGSHALGFLDALGVEQHLVAVHSVPHETARLFGIGSPAHPTPVWWRRLWAAAMAAVLAFALWRTARGADWRDAAAWVTLALLLASAWLLPWYAIWPLPLAAVSGDRRLRAAVLVACAYAVLIHLPLADPLLSPRPVPRAVAGPGVPLPGLGDRLEFSGLEVLRDVRGDLRW